MKVLSKENISEVIENLRNGKIIIFPTETSYGLGCDPTNQQAVDKVFAIKNRIKDKPLLVVVDSIEKAKKYLKWESLLEKMSDYWKDDKGALTVVANYQNQESRIKNQDLVNGVISEDKKLALRVTKDEWLKKICKKFDKPIVATSANLAGEENIYSFAEIEKIFKNHDIILVDGGELKKKEPSTIVSVVDDKIKVLREGEIKFKI